MSGQPEAQPASPQELLTETLQQTQSLATEVRAELLAQLGRLRELSRPVRRQSQYPSVRTVLETLQKVEEKATRAFEQYEQWKKLMKELREHARREQHRRGSAFKLKNEE